MNMHVTGLWTNEYCMSPHICALGDKTIPVVLMSLVQMGSNMVNARVKFELASTVSCMVVMAPLIEARATLGQLTLNRYPGYRDVTHRGQRYLGSAHIVSVPWLL